MHIPDHFLAPKVWGTLDCIALPTLAWVSRRARQNTESNTLPLLGVMGAFVFAAQMINFPVGFGTSGHLVGGTLLACVLGPEAAILTVTAILMIQALVFQDGGVLSLGANIVNMAIVGVITGYLPFSLARNSRWRNISICAGAFLSVLFSGLLALAELALSGVDLSGPLLGFSILLFGINAVMEGAITLTVFKLIDRQRLSAEASSSPVISHRAKAAVTVGLGALFLGTIGVLAASSLPDGIEHLSEKLGISWSSAPVLRAPLPDYEVPALGSGPASRILAGLLGILLVYVICQFGSRLMGRVRSRYSV